MAYEKTMRDKERGDDTVSESGHNVHLVNGLRPLVEGLAHVLVQCHGQLLELGSNLLPCPDRRQKEGPVYHLNPKQTAISHARIAQATQRYVAHTDKGQ